MTSVSLALEETTTQNKAKCNHATNSLHDLKRFRLWVIHTLLSLSITCAMTDDFPRSERNRKQKFVLGVSCVSLIISFIESAVHCFKSTKRYFVGNLFEFASSFILLLLWTIASVVILGPQNTIGNAIDKIGVEFIYNANLYFLTWLSLLSNLHLVASFFHHVKSCDPRILGWILLFFASLILLGISSYLKNGVCSSLIEHEMRCRRTKYAISVGAINGIVCVCVLGLCYKKRKEEKRGNKLSYAPQINLFLSLCSAGLYGFGVVMLTSVGGPARSLGTIYFTTWIGAVLSSLLFLDSFKEVFIGEDDAIILDEIYEKEIDAGNCVYDGMDTSTKVFNKVFPCFSRDEIELTIKSEEKGLHIYEKEMNNFRKVLGSKHPDTLTSISNVAATLRQCGHFDRARPLYEEALAGRREVLGQNHRDTLVSMNNFATYLTQQREYDEARSLYREAISGRKVVLGEDDPETLESIRNLETMERFYSADTQKSSS